MPASLKLTDHSQVDMLGLWYKSVNFGASTALSCMRGLAIQTWAPTWYMGHLTSLIKNSQPP